jgi:TRAP-type mannitol/chloroaromatic compound transport system substrate-binding protein
MFNKTKFNALPPKMRAVIDNAVEAASADMSWKAVDRYSKDYKELATKNNVKFYKTPDSFLQEQLKVWDEVVAKKREGNPLFQEVEKSMRDFAERAMKWDMDTNNPRRMAYNHYFMKKAPEKKA